MPQVQQCQAVITEQAGDVVAAVRRDQGVVGRPADILEAGDCRLARIVHVGDPYLVALVETEDEAVAGCIHQADDLGVLAGGVLRRDVGKQFQCDGIEYPDTAGFVVRHRDQAAILRDGAADAVAGLHDALADGGGQQIDLCQAAVPAEDVGEACVAGKDNGGVRQVAETVDLCKPAVRAVLHHQQLATGALYDNPQVAGAAHIRQRRQPYEQGADKQQRPHGAGSGRIR